MFRKICSDEPFISGGFFRVDFPPLFASATTLAHGPKHYQALPRINPSPTLVHPEDGHRDFFPNDPWMIPTRVYAKGVALCERACFCSLFSRLFSLSILSLLFFCFSRYSLFIISLLSCVFEDRHFFSSGLKKGILKSGLQRTFGTRFVCRSQCS